MKTLNEEINRIKSIMGLIKEEDEITPSNNHGTIIIQGPKQDSIIIGVDHFDKNKENYLTKEDINSSQIDKIKSIATNCGYYYEGSGGDDLNNIEHFFNGIGINNVNSNGSYEPSGEEIESKGNDYKKTHMYTFFSNGGQGEGQWGNNQDKILKYELEKLSDNPPNSIKELIMKGSGVTMFWDNSLDYNDEEKEWFIDQIKGTSNSDTIMSLLEAPPTDENIRKFINTGFLMMWDDRDKYGYKEGNNLLVNMADTATEGRREHIKNNLECGIYFIGEGHISEWEKQFVDTKLIKK
jgi:predicted secreted protein